MPNQIRFKDRTHAGELLALQLNAYAISPNVVVLALPRGGVPVGYAVAKALDVPFDILLVRKLGLPGREEYAMGAIASGGVCILRSDVLSVYDIPPTAIEAMVQRELLELKRREKLYRADRPPLQLRERIVILVDDGLATGATMQVAIQVVRKALPARVIVAVPVAAAETRETLKSEVDDIICLSTPEPFHAVGLWYENFEQTTDEEVIRLLHDAKRLGAEPAHARRTHLAQE